MSEESETSVWWCASSLVWAAPTDPTHNFVNFHFCLTEEEAIGREYKAMTKAHPKSVVSVIAVRCPPPKSAEGAPGNNTEQEAA